MSASTVRLSTSICSRFTLYFAAFEQFLCKLSLSTSAFACWQCRFFQSDATQSFVRSGFIASLLIFVSWFGFHACNCVFVLHKHNQDGSRDGGLTVHSSDATFNRVMEEFAK